MKIVSVTQMRKLDQLAIEAGTAGETLMERAGCGACECLYEWLAGVVSRHCREISVIAGKGNNGGDAYVMARRLAVESELRPKVYSVCPVEELQGDARRNAERLPSEATFQYCPDKLPVSALMPGTVVVDGLLGTGISGGLREPYRTMIRQINESGRPVMALDIPSGLNGDTGEAAGGLVVQADLTVTMGLPKKGLFADTGRIFCGRLRQVNIGLPEETVEAAESAGRADFISDIEPLLQRRPGAAHKNTFGQVLVAAGSSRYIGAPILTAKGSLASGAGLVTAAVPKTAWAAGPGPTLPAALIVRRVNDSGDGYFTHDSISELEELTRQANAVVFGPGVRTEPETGGALMNILKQGQPTVIDADGLNLLAADSESFAGILEQAVLTPHPGEMSRLLHGFGLSGTTAGTRAEQAVQLAGHSGAVVVLKGQATVVAAPSGEYWVSSSGTSALATGGTGDVLAGLIGGMLAQGKSRTAASRIAVFTHGLAAEVSDRAEISFTADDLDEAISEAFKQITPFA